LSVEQNNLLLLVLWQIELDISIKKALSQLEFADQCHQFPEKNVEELDKVFIGLGSNMSNSCLQNHRFIFWMETLQNNLLE
jgi:hypothetical protein